MLGAAERDCAAGGLSGAVAAAGLSALGKGGQWERALDLLGQLETRAEVGARPGDGPGDGRDGPPPPPPPPPPTALHYNATLSALAKSGEWVAALHLLRDMETRSGGHARPNYMSYASALSVGGQLPSV